MHKHQMKLTCLHNYVSVDKRCGPTRRVYVQQLQNGKPPPS